MYLNILGTRVNKCTKCNACIKDCPLQLYRPDDDSVRFFDPEDRCIRCGHCIAVCPINAIDYTAPEQAFSHPKISKPSTLIAKEDLYTFFRARRSVRQYKDMPVDEKAVQRILEVMRHAPTASNREQTAFTVITNPAILNQIKDRVISMFYFINHLLTFLRFIFPFGRKSSGILGNRLYRSLTATLKRIATGYDPVLFHAPVCVIISAPKYNNQAAIDTGIVLTHGMFAAQAEGLSTCLIGFAHEMLVRNRAFCKRLKIPKKHRVQGVMVLGHPAVLYKKAPPRKPLSAEYIN